MSRPPAVEVIPSSPSREGPVLFATTQPSDETLIAEIAVEPCEALFCHRHQTDQLLVLRGAIDLVFLQNRHLHCLHLREDEATWVRIPPGVPHGAINRLRRPAVVVNAVLRHGPSDPRDYQARPIPASLLADWRRLNRPGQRLF